MGTDILTAGADSFTGMTDYTPFDGAGKFVEGTNDFTEDEKARRRARMKAAADTLFRTDISKMDDDAVAGFYTACARGIFGVEDDDGSVVFNRRAGDARANVGLLRDFCSGRYSLETDEDREFDAADEEGRFRIAEKSLGAGQRRRMFMGNARPGGLLDWIYAIGVTTEGDGTGKEAAVARLDYDTMSPEDRKAYRDATVAEYRRRRESRSKVAALMRMTGGLSDRAGDILVQAVSKGEVDRGSFAMLDEDEQQRVAAAVSAVRGEAKRSSILGIGFDTRDAEGDTNTGRLMLRGMQDFMAGMVSGVWDIGKGAAQVAWGKAMLDGAARQEYFDRIRREGLIEGALKQPLPDEENWFADAARGFADNWLWVVPGTAVSKGVGMMGRALGSGGAFGKLSALNLARAGRAAKAAEGKIALEAGRVAKAEAAIKAATEGKTALEIEALASGANATAEAVAYRRMVSAANTYADALRKRRAAYAAARGDWAKGAGLLAAAETATFSNFAMEYVAACDAAGISREDSVPMSAAVGLVNGLLENVHVPGLESSIDSRSLTKILGGAFVEALRTDGGKGLAKWTGNLVRTAVPDALRVAAQEGLVEEPSQQIVTEHAKAMAAALDRFRKANALDPDAVRLADYAKVALEANLPVLARDWRTYVETVAEVLPTSAAFGVYSPANQAARKALRDRARRRANAAAWERTQAEFAERNERAAGLLERFAEIDERNGDAAAAKARRDQAKALRERKPVAPTMANGGGAASLDWDEGLAGIIQERIDARKAVEEHWANAEQTVPAEPGSPQAADDARARGNRFAEAEARAREILRTAEPGSDTTQMIADEFGVDPQTAEVVESWIMAEEEMKLYSPVAKELSTSTAFADITADNVATVVPGYVDGSFSKDERTGTVAASYTGADGKVRTIAYVVGDMGAMIGDRLRENAKAGSAFGASYDARYSGREGYVPWSALSDKERERIVWTLNNGYRSGQGGTFVFTAADGSTREIAADDVVYLANGRLADVGYAGSHATLETARHETWHSIWAAYSETLPADELKGFAEGLGVDTSVDEKSWRKELDEAVAYQVEAYASGHWVPNAVAAHIDRFSETALGRFVQTAARWITQDPGRIDPKTGREWNLKSFMDAYQRGELRVPQGVAAAPVNAKAASVNAQTRSAGAPVGVSAEEVRAQQADDAAAAEAAGEGAFSASDAKRFGIGSASRNGPGFKDLERGDTFQAIESVLTRQSKVQVTNERLGITASIGSGRKARHVAMYMKPGELPEVHKFAAKNVLGLFRSARLAFRHDERKDDKPQSNKWLRAFAPFMFGDEVYVATITVQRNLETPAVYSVETVETEQGTRNPEGISQGNSRASSPSAPATEFKVPSLASRIAEYYSNGKGKDTHPEFVGVDGVFSPELMASMVESDVNNFADSMFSGRLQEESGASAPAGEQKMHATGSFSVTSEEDAAYMDAVKRGDMKTAERMVKPLFDAYVRDHVISEANAKALFARIAKRHNEDERGAYSYGIRKDDRLLVPESVFPNSHQLFQDQEYDDDGNPLYPEFEYDKSLYDAGELDGTSTIGFTVYGNVDDTAEGIDLRGLYADGYAYLVAGDEVGTGYDPGESLISEAKVLSVLKIVKQELSYGIGNSEFTFTDKSDAPVTYDDAGNVIPLSKRFNDDNPDIRFSVSGSLVYDTSGLGETVNESSRDVAFSVAADKDLMDAATQANNASGKVPFQVMMQALDDRRRIYRIFSDPKQSEDLGLPPDEMGKTSIGNASYGMTMENSTICTRTLGYEELADLVAEWLDRPLTAEEALYVAQQAMNYTDKPQCLYCYVAMDRMGKREFYGTYVDQRDAVLNDIDSGMSVKKAYERFLAGRKDTRQMKDRFTMWVNLHRKGAELIGKRDLASTRRMTEAAGKGEAHRIQVRDAERYAQSAAWAKKKIDYHAYNGEILRWKQSLVDSMNRQFGLRFYSFSDYTAAFVLENMQQITDASVRGLKGLGYTKELDFVDVFAETQMNINISTFGFEDEKTGEILCDGMQGADWAEARKRRDMYGNVGITFVATNDRQVEWALDQDWIDCVIPYHLVRTGDRIAKFMGWTNYKSMQEDVKTGDWEKGDKKAIFPHEHNNDRATYFRLLEENHLTPRFAKWTGHRNYMKLVNETRRAAKDTPAMQPVFDAEAALRSIETMRNRGGYFEHIGVHAENTDRIAKDIAGGIRAGAKPTPAAAFRPGQGGGSFSAADEGSFSSAFPALGNMSADDVLVAYTASRIAIGKSDRPSDRSVNLGLVKRELKAVHPDWDEARIAQETQRVARDAQALAGGIRADLDRGVSQSVVLQRLPESMKATFGREMRTQARRGAAVGGYAEKAEAELAARKARVVADAVSVQTGVAYRELENAYGLDLSKTMLNIATNPSIRRDAEGNIIPPANGARAVEEAGAGVADEVAGDGSDEGRPVDARVQAAVAEVVAMSAEQRAREKAKPDPNEENRRNAAGHAAEAEDEMSGAGGLEGADPVAIAVRKHGVDMEDPRQMALFVVELARRWWIDNHGLAKDANPWSDPVAVQFLRRTAQGVYGKLVEEITYSRGRDTATRKIGDFVHVPTVAGLMTEMTLVGSIINRNMIRETQKQMCERLDLFLREKLGASGRFKADNEELRRRVPAEIELRARYMRHAMWLTPAAAAEEAAALQRELEAAAVDFAAEGHDVDQSRVAVEITRKLNILREFGALQYRPVARIEAAFQWWQDAEQGGAVDIAQAFAEREVRTKKAAAVLARAFANAKKAFAAEGRSLSELAGRYAQSHMAFTHLLRDLMRFASPSDREEAERIVRWLELEVQKNGTRATTEKRRHADALAEAVKRIYGVDIAKVVADLGKVDERFAKFMTRIDGKPVEPTRGRAIQLLASLLQVGRQVEVQDPEDPSRTVVQWVGGYHDNIVENGREGQAEELRKLLTPADLNLVAWLGQWYEQNRSELSDVCERLFGIGVYAETSNYMPVKMLLEDQGLEKGAAVGWAVFPKALMPRVRNHRDFDTRQDVLGMFMSRMEEGAQWKAFADLGLELRGIFGRADLQGAVVAGHGKAAKDNLLSFITDILAGSGAGARSKGDFMAYVDTVRGWAAIGALGGNVGVMLKQTTSIPAFGFEIGLWNTARHMATAFTPDGLAAMAEIWNSQERANRWNVGNSEAVANALARRDTSWIKKAWKASMVTNRLGDAVPALVVGQGIYRDALARGMSREDAMAFTWMLVERTQQSSRIENQPLFQRRFKAGNAIYQFLSTQLQYLNYELRDIRAVASDPGSARKWGRLANTVAINHFLLSSAYYWMGQLWRAALGQEPPEDQLSDWVVSMLMGPWGALYAAGITCTDAVNTWVKGYKFGQGGGIASLQWLSNVFVHDPYRLMSDIVSGEKTSDDVLDDLGKWASDFNATFRDMRKVKKNYFDKD